MEYLLFILTSGILQIYDFILNNIYSFISNKIINCLIHFPNHCMYALLYALSCKITY